MSSSREVIKRPSKGSEKTAQPQVEGPSRDRNSPPDQITVLNLQRTIGNQAVKQLIQRDPPTVDVRDLPMADADQEKIRKAAVDNLLAAADTFANLWYSANNGALAGAAEPDDPDFVSQTGMQAKAAFGIALAGNLVWAAACLMPQTATVAIAAMSFGGAAVGSGAVSTLAGTSPQSAQPSFKAVSAKALATARDRLAAQSKDVVKDVAGDCAVSNVSDAEEQRRRLWAKIFKTAYDQAEPIETAAAAKLAKAAPDFVKQWQAHKSSKAVQDEADRRTDERIKRDGYPWSVRLRTLVEPSGPGGPADEYRLGVFNEEWMKYAVETFKPVLNFD